MDDLLDRVVLLDGTDAVRLVTTVGLRVQQRSDPDCHFDARTAFAADTFAPEVLTVARSC